MLPRSPGPGNYFTCARPHAIPQSLLQPGLEEQRTSRAWKLLYSRLFFPNSVSLRPWKISKPATPPPVAVHSLKQCLGRVCPTPGLGVRELLCFWLALGSVQLTWAPSGSPDLVAPKAEILVDHRPHYSQRAGRAGLLVFPQPLAPEEKPSGCFWSVAFQFWDSSPPHTLPEKVLCSFPPQLKLITRKEKVTGCLCFLPRFDWETVWLDSYNILDYISVLSEHITCLSMCMN